MGSIFEALFSRRMVAGFDGGAMTSDGGGLLRRETDRRLNLLSRLSECFLDRRSPLLVKHSVAQMLAQRVYGLALGYEDLNDHAQLRHAVNALLVDVFLEASDPAPEEIVLDLDTTDVELHSGQEGRFFHG